MLGGKLWNFWSTCTVLQCLMSHASCCHLPYFEVYAKFQWWPTTSLLVSPHDTWWVSSALTDTWVCAIVLWGVCAWHNGLQLHQSVHKWRLTSVCSRTYSSCILKYKTILSSIPIGWPKCHNVIIFSFIEVPHFDKYYHIGNQQI